MDKLASPTQMIAMLRIAARHAQDDPLLHDRHQLSDLLAERLTVTGADVIRALSAPARRPDRTPVGAWLRAGGRFVETPSGRLVPAVQVGTVRDQRVFVTPSGIGFVETGAPATPGIDLCMYTARPAPAVTRAIAGITPARSTTMADNHEREQKPRRTPYETITAAILEQMQKPMQPWERPWARPGLSLPRNAATNRSYNGVNVATLWGAADARGYPESRWATFRQWQERGGMVRKGEHGVPVLWFKMYEPQDGGRDAERTAAAAAGDADSDPEKSKRIPVARLSYVFNAAQVDGIAPEKAPDPIPLDQRYEAAERIIRESGAVIRHGYTRSYYAPQSDEIHLPDKAAFKAVGGATALENYYSTVFHELGHWSGAHDRLDRQFGARFGDSGYAQEELTAELTSAFLCVQSGVTPTAREDHAQYLKSWQKVLHDDPKAFTRAASAAQKASDYVLARGRELTQERTQVKVAQDTSYEFVHQHDGGHRVAQSSAAEFAHQHGSNESSMGLGRSR